MKNSQQLILTLLSTVEESSVLGCVTDLDDLCTCQQLHDEGGGDDGGETQLHQSTCTDNPGNKMVNRNVNQNITDYFSLFKFDHDS